jgi:hypothetical protein
VLPLPIAALVEDAIGLSAQIEHMARNRALGGGPVIGLASLRVDRNADPALFAALRGSASRWARRGGCSPPSARCCSCARCLLVRCRRSGRWRRCSPSRTTGRSRCPRPLAARLRLVEPGGFTRISALGPEEQRGARGARPAGAA